MATSTAAAMKPAFAQTASKMKTASKTAPMIRAPMTA